MRLEEITNELICLKLREPKYIEVNEINDNITDIHFIEYICYATRSYTLDPYTRKIRR